MAMTPQEYEQKKRECWKRYKRDNWESLANAQEAFNYAFDRAYALGREKETISQENIQKAAEKYAAEVDKNVRDIYGIEEQPASLTFGECAAESFREGVNFALGKQEKDTVIQGWVCRDKKDDALNLHAEEPYRTQSGYQIGDKPDWWESDCASFLPLDKNLFPDLTWDDDPIEVEIVIKRKKK